MTLLIKCMRCDGCGWVANSEEHEPWTAWASLPPGSDLAVRLGLVTPVACEQCDQRGALVAADVGGPVPARELEKKPVPT